MGEGFEGFSTVKDLPTGDRRFNPGTLDPKGGEITFFWPYPDASMLTDEAVRGLVDQKFVINEKRQTFQGRIIGAVNHPENAGVMLTVTYRKRNNG